MEAGATGLAGEDAGHRRCGGLFVVLAKHALHSGRRRVQAREGGSGALR